MGPGECCVLISEFVRDGSLRGDSSEEPDKIESGEGELLPAL